MSNENQQNISEVLELLKQSYGDDADDAVKQSVHTEDSEIEAVSDEELKAKLKLQFSAKDDMEMELSDDPYSIDEDFIAEAESPIEEDAEEEFFAEEAINEEDQLEEQEFDLVEIADAEEAIDDTFEDEIIDGDAQNDASDLEEEYYFDEEDGNIELEEENEDSFVEMKEDLDEEDDITFDELEDSEATEDDGLVLTKIDLDEDDTDIFEDIGDELSFVNEDDITFEDLADFEQTVDDNSVTNIEDEGAGKIRSMIIDENLKEELEYLARKESMTEENVDYLVDESTEEAAEEVGSVSESVEATDDYLNEFFENESEQTEEDTVFDAYVKNAEDDSSERIDNSELSLLMQFGCEADDLNKYVAESSSSNQNEKTEEKAEDPKTAEYAQKRDKILEKYAEYSQRFPGLIFRFVISTVMAVILAIYELLPIFGVIDRGMFSIPYILIGIACTVACLCSSYKQLWEGAKQITVNKPTGYSMVCILAVVTLIYDFSLFFLRGDAADYPVFHFALACVMILAILFEWINIKNERKCFEFYFKDIINSGEENKGSYEDSVKTTLYLSEGKNSTAEKMYSGGLDSSQKIYTSVETKRVEACFNALQKRSKKTYFSMYIVIPSVVISVIMLFVVLILRHDIQEGFCAMMLTLLLTLPIISSVGVWLPFDRMRAKGAARGYAFASEKSMESYSNADMLIFKDTHLFAKVHPSNVNLVLYDATPNDVLISCLDCVYSRIGGPMSNSFKGSKKNFENCRIVRVAKSGIEAVVENNYSVLVGSEAFMQRYGISFPNVALNNKEDKVFTLCVSINGRASARLAARYAVNDMFEMFSARLAENEIYSVIETFDPMINTELISRVLPKNHTPLNIVHLNAKNLVERNISDNDEFLFDVAEKELELVTHTSRLNLAVALTDAKQMKTLRKRVNWLSVGFSTIGLILTTLASIIGFTAALNEFLVLLIWGLSLGGLLALVLCTMPKNDKFSFERFLQERETLRSLEENTEE